MRKIKLVILILFSGLLLCSVNVAYSETQVEIEHMTVVPPDYPYARAMQEVFQMYMKKHPNVQIRYNYVQYEDFFGQLAVRAMAGKAPALAQAGYHTPEFAEAGVLVEMGPYLEKSGWKKENFWPGIWNLTVYKGRQWGVPFTVDTRVMFYNKDLFQKVGIQPPKTWDEWLSAGKKFISSTDVYYYGMVGSGAAHFVWTFTPFVFSNEGQWIKQGSDGLWYSNVTDQKVIEALEFGRSMISSGLVQPSWASDDVFVTQKLFTEGRAATILSGPWMIDTLSDAEKKGELNFQWGQFLIPRKVVHASTTGGWAWYAFKKDDVNPDIQWDIINFCLQNIDKGWPDSLPPTKKGMELPKYQDKKYDYMKKALENSYFPAPVIYGYWELLDLLWTPCIQVLSGEKSAKEIMKEASIKVQNLLNEKQNALFRKSSK